MRKGILMAALLLLVACSSTGDKRYYQLPIGTDAAPLLASPRAATSHLWLSRINLSDYLAGNGVVYQTSDVQYVTAGNNLWASPLEQQLQQAMLANLNNALPGTLVSASQAPGEQDQLEVDVTGFHGRYDGKVVIRGEWRLTHNGTVSRFPINMILTQDKDGYDALVRTLAQGWQQVCQHIAKQITAMG
ncbi:membrane integrity-associated transporter subunit PqiC [Sodalis sp. dw_96]|uniref:membrane integrity-associated transporter subunit PqiC n=1 Tax=Sodalis sp. dw_96 TaxID=2719794 RepID=UPI001BD64B48|nr:membrane integrity-associated transporter subunit PqiC [Sodalis sp. dw_96]